MRVVVVLLVVATTLAHAAVWSSVIPPVSGASLPPVPSVSASFLATLDVSIRAPRGTTTAAATDQLTLIAHGTGVWAVDFERGLGVQTIEADHAIAGRTIERWDQKAVYRLASDSSCVATPLMVPKMPHPFAWLKTASYEGSLVVKDIHHDLWSFQMPMGSSMQLAVLPLPHTPQNNYTHRPAFLIHRSHLEVVIYEFQSWQTSRVPSTIFSLPKSCTPLKSTTPVGDAATPVVPASVVAEVGVRVSRNGSDDSDSGSGSGSGGNWPASGCTKGGCDNGVSNCIAGRHFLSIFCDCFVSATYTYDCQWDKFCGHD